MLVLTRYVQDRVFITYNGVRITVVVVEIDGNKVKLGFDAPADVRIHREEVEHARNAARKGTL